jgi:hypothetical protein
MICARNSGLYYIFVCISYEFYGRETRPAPCGAEMAPGSTEARRGDGGETRRISESGGNSPAGRPNAARCAGRPASSCRPAGFDWPAGRLRVAGRPASICRPAGSGSAPSCRESHARRWDPALLQQCCNRAATVLQQYCNRAATVLQQGCHSAAMAEPPSPTRATQPTQWLVNHWPTLWLINHRPTSSG